MSKVEQYITSIPDYPKAGIIFRDITSVLKDADGLRLAVDEMTAKIGDTEFDAIVGLESRGFLFGMPMAYNLHKAFIPVRKSGKLPRATSRIAYDLEYGSAEIEVHREDIMPIVMSCLSMSKQKVGALIVIERYVGLSEIINSGDQINANITQRLIENIFFKNSPLHDGAMIISHKRIKAAGCILPIAHNTDIPKSLGLRHRAALGISQKSDCLAIIVSEETGGISIAENGNFKLRLSAEELESILSKEWER